MIPVRLRKMLRFLTVGLVVILAVVCVAATLIASTTVRNWALDFGFRRADSALPGSISAAHASWHRLSAVHLKDLLWVDGQDTLVLIQELEISLSIGALLKRDLVLTRLFAGGIRADIAAVRERLENDTQERSSPVGESPEPFFPRLGALPGLPSMAIRELELHGSYLRLASTSSFMRLDAHAATNLLHGHAPRFTVTSLTAQSSTEAWGVNEARATFDLLMGDLEVSAHCHLGPEWPVFVEASTDEERRFWLSATVADEKRFPEDVGLWAAGRFRMGDSGVEAIEFETTLKTPRTDVLAEHPALRRAMAEFPPREGIVGTLSGTVGLDAEFSAEGTLRIERNRWIDGGILQGRFHPNQAIVDTFALILPGLQISGRGQNIDRVIDARVALRTWHRQWAQDLALSVPFPDSLAIDFEAEAAGPVDAPRFRGRLDASLKQNGIDHTQLHLSVDDLIPGHEPGKVGLEARTSNLFVSGNGEVEIDRLVKARIAPLRIISSAAQSDRRDASLPTHDTMVYDPATRRIRLDGFEVDGDLGTYSLDADFDQTFGGEMRLSAVWPQLPATLTQAVGFSPETESLVRQAWEENGPFSLDLGATVVRDSSGSLSVNAVGGLLLPGPRTLAALLPSEAAVESLGAIRGELRFDSQHFSDGQGWISALDFGQTDWIDHGLVIVSGQNSRVNLDSVMFAAEGVTLKGQGVVDSQKLSGFCHIGIADFCFARRLLPSLSQDVDGKAEVEAKLSGTIQEPSVDARLTGEVRSPTLTIPLIHGSLDVENGSPRFLSLEAPDGARAGSLILTRARVQYVPSTQRLDGPLIGSLVLDGAAPSLEFFHRVEIDAREGFRAMGDTLFLSIGDETLVSQRPYLFAALPDGFELSHLDLAGTMGWIRGEGKFLQNDPDLSVDARVDLSGSPSLFRLPDGFQARHADITVRSSSLDSLFIDGLLTGFRLGSRHDVQARALVTAKSPMAHIGLTVFEKHDTLLVGSGEVPIEFSLWPLRFDFLEESIRITAATTEFPLPGPLGREESLAQYFKGTHEEMFPIFTGRVVGGGRFSELTSGISGTITFPGMPRLSRYRVKLLGVHSLNRSLDETTLQSLEIPALRLTEKLQSSLFVWPGFVGELVVTRLDTITCVGFLALPAATRDDGPQRSDIPSGVIHFELRSDRFKLADLSPILPPSMDLRGDLQFDLLAVGPTGNPQLEGKASVSGLEVITADGSKVAATGKIEVHGPATEPTITGDLAIERGVIRVPDAPKSLLPVEGQALLWEHWGELEDEQVRTTQTADDSTRWDAAQPSAPDQARNQDHPAPQMKANVSVRVPGRLWIRGRGLDVELAGELQTVLRGLEPTLVGELRAVSGSLLFLGRRFTVEQGQVVFFGDDEINPALDLALAARLDDTVIRITVSGTAKEPALTLSSDPELSEGDIMAYLVFGKKLDELDSDQTTFVRTRALEFAKNSALAKLEDRLSRELGVDMLTVKQGGVQGGKGSIVVGKYVSRRALVRYEQALEATLGYMITLEYWLARSFALLTYLSHTDQSGVEMNWTKDY